MNAETIIETTLSNWDPFRLVRFPNQREYDIEARLIADQLPGIQNFRDLTTTIHNVLTESFGGLRVNFDKYLLVAESIWDNFNDVAAVS